MHLPVDTLLHGNTYRIVRFINSGGFGCTYEAEHVMLQKRVAIKEFFVKDFCNRDEMTAHITVGTVSKTGLVEKLRRKFIEEARALCKLQHPGIVRVSDVFEENGTAYYVMDYIDGKTISEIVNQEGALPEFRAVLYIKQIAEALQYVHDNNRLHLDIKPGNIMVGRDDRPILIDFGASKQYDEDAGENTSTLVGKTPGYAPPEQMANHVMKFMPATDIYALGATLYKMLTGITPLDAHTRISEAMTPIPAYISEPVREAVAAAMKLNKNERLQTLNAFLAIMQGPVQVEDEQTRFETDMPKKTETDAPVPEPVPVPEPATDGNGNGNGNRGILKGMNKWVMVSVIAVVTAIIIVVGASLVAREKKEHFARHRYDDLRSLCENNIKIGGPENYAALVEARSLLDSLKAYHAKYAFLSHQKEGIGAMEKELSSKLSIAQKAWIRSAKGQYEIAGDIPRAISFYHIASFLSPSAEITAAIDDIAKKRNCKGAYMAVTQSYIEGDYLYVSYNGLNLSEIGETAVQYELIPDNAGNTAARRGQVKVSIKPGNDHRLRIEIKNASSLLPCRLELSCNNIVFYRNKMER